MTKRSLGTCPPSPPIPLEIGKAIEFPISGRMGFQAISVEPYWTWWPLQIAGFHPLMVSHLQRHFSLCFVGRLCHHGKAFLFAENHRAREPALGGGGRVRLSRGWASREWLRFGFSGLQSLFSVYQRINHGFQIGLPGCQQDWVKTLRCWVWDFSMSWWFFSRKIKGYDSFFIDLWQVFGGSITYLILSQYKSRWDASILLSFLVSIRVHSNVWLTRFDR